MTYNGARPKEKRDTRHKNGDKKETKRSPYKEFHHHLSIRLFNVLDYVGASKEIRELRQECSLSREIIITTYNQLDQDKIPAYILGSSSEGTTTTGLHSDLDVLLCYELPVVDNISEAVDENSLIMIRDTHTQPGYVKLQRVYKRQRQTVYTQKGNHENRFDCEGKLCIQHLSSLGQFDAIDARNGPADTMTDRKVDTVIGFKCSTIPDFAREWIVRDRFYQWPSNRTLYKMTTMGCFLVGVGHPYSKERDIQWRLSFSLQEREVMFSLNMVQHKCYIILKMIKKDLIEPIVGKSLSSYHLKTCLFHVIENTKIDFWKRRNLAQCILLCMHVLFKWVCIGKCPNYFIKEENMFDKTIFMKRREDLIQQLQILLSHGCGLAFLIKRDYVGVFLKHGIREEHKQFIRKKARLMSNSHLISTVLNFRRTLSFSANKQNNPRKFISTVLKYVQQIQTITEHSKKQTQEALSYILPFIHLHLAQSEASLSFNTYNTDDNVLDLQSYGDQLQAGRHCDLTSSIL